MIYIDVTVERRDAMHILDLIVEDEQLAVCRLSPEDVLPNWAMVGGFCSITRTSDELSIVCPDDRRIPEGVRCERGWRVIRVGGTQAFTLTGVLSSVLEPLARSGISIFAISTFDTDYVMVKSESLEAAVIALRAVGHHVEQ